MTFRISFLRSRRVTTVLLPKRTSLVAYGGDGRGGDGAEGLHPPVELAHLVAARVVRLAQRLDLKAVRPLAAPAHDDVDADALARERHDAHGGALGLPVEDEQAVVLEDEPAALPRAAGELARALVRQPPLPQARTTKTRMGLARAEMQQGWLQDDRSPQLVGRAVKPQADDELVTLWSKSLWSGLGPCTRVGGFSVKATFAYSSSAWSPLAGCGAGSAGASVLGLTCQTIFMPCAMSLGTGTSSLDCS